MTRMIQHFNLARTAKVCCTLAVVLLSGRTTVAVNLLGNAGFETPNAPLDVSNAPGAPWIGFGDPNNRYTTQQLVPHSGSQSIKTFGPFGPGAIGGGGGATQKVLASPGDTFVGEIYAQNSFSDAIQGFNFGVYKIEFLNSAGALVSGGLAGADIFESNKIDASTQFDEWTLLGVGTAPAPVGTHFAQAVIVGVQLGDNNGDPNGTPLGGAIYWDDASLVRLPPAAVPGDYNGNGVVDAADYVLWRNGDLLLNEVATPGSTTPEDYTQWRARFGNTAGAAVGAAAAVPEPSSCALLLLGAVISAIFGRRATAVLT